MSHIKGAHRLILRDHTFDLLPQRAIYWREQKTLIVADVHLGKAQTFQRAGLAVPGTPSLHDLERLENLLVVTDAQSLLVLGDFVHHRTGLTDAVRDRIAAWCSNLKAEVHVILGNHDRPNHPFLAGLPLRLWEKSRQWGPFEFAHEHIASERFCFIGHFHPVIHFRFALRLPVFAFYENHCVLPAFSYFTGGMPVERKGLQQAFVPLEDESLVCSLAHDEITRGEN